MFLKSLTISKYDNVIRSIPFHKGINLIVDETKSNDKRESGNNVGKTTVLRLIDFCLGGDGKNIYKDPEFKTSGNTQIEQFLKDNNIIIELILKEAIEEPNSKEIVIRRNFLSYKKKIQQIDGIPYNNVEFPKRLKELVFKSSKDKPTFRQLISKNIRDERNRLINTVNVLHPNTTKEEYEALFLFWLGIDLDDSSRKQYLSGQRKIEENLQKRLRKENNLSRIQQSLIIINRDIEELTIKKNSFNLNEHYEEDLSALNEIKSEINKLSSKLGSLELRKDLIEESQDELGKEISEIDIQQIADLYREAKSLIPNIQKSFEDTLSFHNRMVKEKIKYITQDLPELEEKIKNTQISINEFLLQEKQITKKLQKSGAIEDLEKIISDLNEAFERKGTLEEQRRLWETSNNKLVEIEDELEEINQGIRSKNELIQNRIADFNVYFSNISSKLYGEQFFLSSDINERGLTLVISSISGNLGTGKKKGQMAAFDLAYIQFADKFDIDCLHFILQDQIENVHRNQISNLLTEIVSSIDCQYVLPVLRDKLPDHINIKPYEILSLSQEDKLFRV